MSLESYSNTLLTSIISEYMPFGSTSLKITAGLFSTELLKSISKIRANSYINKLFGKKYIVIDSEDIIIYSKFEEYLIHKYFNLINRCHLTAKNGEITIKLKTDTFLSYLTDKFNDKDIYIRIQTTEKKDKNDNNLSFHISSKTSSIENLKLYVQESINNIDKTKTKLLTIYKTKSHQITDKKEKKYISEWEKIYSNTNKNFKNTIVTESVYKNFYEDVKYFINNENFYVEKGIPYKRGYMLYGLPGCGKSSLIKALSNEFSLDIFCIDLETLDNESLNKLVNEINYLTNNNKKHILVFEDIDRSKIFNERYHYDENKKVTIGNLINILDGIVETNGQIIIMTANDISKITEHKALSRPGRIDKFIELTYCDNDQLVKLFNLFYPENDKTVVLEKIKNIKSKTPAECIQVFQTYPNNYIESLDNLCNNISNDFTIYNLNNKLDKRSSRRSIKRISKKIQLNTLHKSFNRINNSMDSILKKNIKMINNYNKQKRKLETGIEKDEEKRLTKKRKI